MKKIFLDTNVWLRFLLEDNEQAKSCRNLIKQIEAGKFRVYTSSIVMLEINFVLTAIYKIKPSQVIKDLETILKTRGLVLIEKTDFKQALVWYKQFKVKLADCLIASQLAKGMIFASFDRDFIKLPLTVKKPDEII